MTVFSRGEKGLSVRAGNYLFTGRSVAINGSKRRP